MHKFSWKNFTYDEFNHICIFYEETKSATMKALADKRDRLTDKETERKNIIDSTLEKMKALSDKEFAEIENYCAFD